ncbi:hypothetical protein AYI68_g2 [Smittium mucronatum]|uniref:Uncharacterized protein n=1 Tax=Smittium mucronatum TaxID=133383 RepID=A0A1R0H9D7_9FUNG|nr:hypothetical protein AYI68_g2 [Smittium mucronatum]
MLYGNNNRCDHNHCNIDYYFGKKRNLAVRARLQCSSCPNKPSNLACMNSLAKILRSGRKFVKRKLSGCNGYASYIFIKSRIGDRRQIETMNVSKYGEILRSGIRISPADLEAISEPSPPSSHSHNSLSKVGKSHWINPITAQNLKFMLYGNNNRCDHNHCNIDYYFGKKRNLAVRARLQCSSCPNKPSNLACMNSLAKILRSGRKFVKRKLSGCNGYASYIFIKSRIGDRRQIEKMNVSKYGEILK